MFSLRVVNERLTANRIRSRTRRGEPYSQGGRTSFAGGANCSPEPSFEPSSEPSEERTARQACALPGRDDAVGAPDVQLDASDPSTHYAVVLKLAFEVDINEPWTDRVDVLKTRCAALRIPYDGAVIGSALLSAERQRRHPRRRPSHRVHSCNAAHGIAVQ